MICLRSAEMSDVTVYNVGALVCECQRARVRNEWGTMDACGKMNEAEKGEKECDGMTQ